MIYSFPYILIVLLYGLMAFLLSGTENETYKKRIVYASIALFLLFWGFRGFILTDWVTYYPYYKELEWNEVFYFFDEKKFGYEPGFALLTMTCKTIFPNYFFFNIVIAIINTIFLYRFFKKYMRNIPLAIMLYIAFEGIYIITNLLRNSIAISLFLAALPYLEERKPVPYFSLCLLAATFHLSALIYLPLYFFFHIRLNKWIYLGIFIATNIAFISHVSIVISLFELMGLNESMTEKVRIYTEIYTSSAKVFSIGYIERLMTGFLIFLYYEKLKDLHPKSGIFINAILIYLSVFFLFSEFEVIAERIYILFAFGYWIIWGYLIECFYYQNNRKLFAGFIMVYCILKTFGNTSAPAFDYENILTGAKSYTERLYFHNKTYKSKE